MSQAPRPRGPLLHNMSAPPTTVIHHPGGERRVCAHAWIFALPVEAVLASGKAVEYAPGCLPPAPAAAEWLTRLDGEPCALPPAEADAELRRRLNAQAPTLPLPAAAVVTDRPAGGDSECCHLLSILTVLSKSSDHVYLRDKEPNLASLRPGRRVVVLLPRRAG